jgi:hypothetical protein
MLLIYIFGFLVKKKQRRDRDRSPVPTQTNRKECPPNQMHGNKFRSLPNAENS